MTVPRKRAEYVNLSSKFKNKPLDYSRQYCNIYKARLNEMETYAMKQIERKWGSRYPIYKLHKLSEKKTDKCIVIGILFKDQKLKPSILKQISEANQLTPQPLLSNFSDESDRLFIEDELQRYEILGSLDGKKLVTGITVALLGTDVGTGKFQVEDHLFCGYRNQIELPILNDDTYVIFLSGLDFVNYDEFFPHLSLFMGRIGGLFGDMNYMTKVVKVIIAGNSIRNVPEERKPSISLTSREPISSETFVAVRDFDNFLMHICHIIDIIVMPGQNDPSNHILPQKQMHMLMFPNGFSYGSLKLVSNPFYCSLDGVRIMGTSGQPITDIIRYSEIEDPLEAMEGCLKWGHLAPTAPDTLGCFPFYNEDPFILDECPHVFFAGNQPRFGAKIVNGDDGQKVCLISIPEFTKTFEAVVLNMKNLECSTMKFDVCD